MTRKLIIGIEWMHVVPKKTIAIIIGIDNISSYSKEIEYIYKNYLIVSSYLWSNHQKYESIDQISVYEDKLQTCAGEILLIFPSSSI